jgi:hypothetical protein
VTAKAVAVTPAPGACGIQCQVVERNAKARPSKGTAVGEFVVVEEPRRS